MGLHPLEDELAAFSAGTLDEEALSRIEGHLTGCADCRERIKSVPPDRLTLLLREPTGALDRAADAEEFDGELPGGLVRHPRYRVVSRVGSGGMGVVFKAEHRLMKRIVALKIISPRLTTNGVAVVRFRREVEAVAKLAHANIAAAYDADEVDGQLVLVEEYVEGTDLAQVVQDQGPLPVGVACGWVRQAALALQHAHERGILHRDIKPHNLIVTRDGRVKVLDFGLACLRGQEEKEGTGSPVTLTTHQNRALTDFGQGMGTADFVAPEQVRDAHAADVRSDIYSLGRTLLYLLTGRADAPPGTSVPQVPSALVGILDRMTTPDPEQRFQTMSDVAAALAPFLVERKRVGGWWRWFLAVGAVVLVGLLFWVAFSLIGGKPTSSTSAENGSKAGLKAGCIWFSRPTDSILVTGRTVQAKEATLEARVLFTEESRKYGALFNEWAAGAVDNYLGAGPDLIEAALFPPAGAGAKVSMNRNEWHHVAYVYDGKQDRLYLDGKVVWTNRSTGPVGRGQGVGFVGAAWRPPEMPRKGFVGYLDTLRVSKVARYSGEQFDPPTGKLPTDAHTLLLYNFTESPGSVSVEDESGNGRRGLLGVGFSGATCPDFVPDPTKKE